MHSGGIHDRQGGALRCHPRARTSSATLSVPPVQLFGSQRSALRPAVARTPLLLYRHFGVAFDTISDPIGLSICPAQPCAADLRPGKLGLFCIPGVGSHTPFCQGWFVGAVADWLCFARLAPAVAPAGPAHWLCFAPQGGFCAPPGPLASPTIGFVCRSRSPPSPPAASAASVVRVSPHCFSAPVAAAQVENMERPAPGVMVDRDHGLSGVWPLVIAGYSRR